MYLGENIMNIEMNYKRWLNSPLVKQQDKDILKKMSVEEKNDAFYKNVEFGTAGMRGILGPGTNRLNEFTVRKATVGFALYLLEKYPNALEAGVVIAHDNRHFSREFTLQSAKVFNEFGIKAYIFDSLRPTPELSFAVRKMKAVGGIMITASHNPKEYNGYKVYDENGCQLVPHKINRLVEIISSLPSELDVEYTPTKIKGKTITLGQEIDDEYVKLVEGIALNKKIRKTNFKIVFTPNHGTAYVNGMRIFKDLGYDVYPLLKQCTPDPDFSNTLSPNPEDDRSFIEPIKYAKEIGAKLIVMTDPDGDRCGLACLNKQKEYQTFTGNQSAAMLLDYILTYKKLNNMPLDNHVIYNTIVTSPLGEKIAKEFGLKCESFLTGFKFIGDRIDYYEKNGGPTFEFGYEELYGCLIAPFARDKDGLQAITLYSEMANYYDKKKMSLDMVWDMIGEKYGYHLDEVYNLPFIGPEGEAKMKILMDTLHSNPFIVVDDNPVVRVEDYLISKSFTKGKNGIKEKAITLPKSNVVKLIFKDHSYIAVRPSGTEPKVKFYIGVVSNKKEVDNKKRVKALLDGLKLVLELD